MTLGSFIHCIHEFLKYENALKLDFKFEKSDSNNYVFENLISSLKNLLVIIIVFENLISILKKLVSNNF